MWRERRGSRGLAPDDPASARSIPAIRAVADLEPCAGLVMVLEGLGDETVDLIEVI
jgi:hypothetical protein